MIIPYLTDPLLNNAKLVLIDSLNQINIYQYLTVSYQKFSLCLHS